MSKFALRVKRYFSPKRGRGARQTRPKTFKTEEAAHTWAKAQGYTNYSLDNMKSAESKEKKIRVVVEI